MTGAAGRRRPVSILLSYAYPTLGMEKAALALAEQLAEDRDVTVTVMRGRAPEVPGAVGHSLAPSASRGSYLRPYLALARWRPERGASFVVVGAWAAIPWLVLNLVKRVPTVVWEHSLARETLGGSRRRTLLFLLGRRLYRTASLVVAVGEPLAEDLRSPGGPEVRVIPNPVVPAPGPNAGPEAGPDAAGPDAAGAEPQDGRLRVLCVGSHTANKRYEVAVRVAAAMPDVRVDLAGQGPRTDELRALVDELGVGDRVTLHGHLQSADLLTLYRRADVLLHPSGGETFGMVFIEAAEHRVPVVANANRAAQEMVPTYAPGALFDGTVEDAVHVLSSGGYRSTEAEFAEAAARRADAFSPERVRALWDAAL